MSRTTRFWLGVGLLVVLNFVAIALVSSQGARSESNVPVNETRSGASTAATPEVSLAGSSHLIVLRRQDDVTTAWQVDPADAASSPITASRENVGLVAASPSGAEIAYTSQVDNARWSLSITSLGGATKRALRTNQEDFVSSLAWSPAGDVLAYELSQVFDSAVSRPRIWLVRTDGSDAALLYGRGQESGSNPVWARDGRQLAFYENQQRVIGIYDFTTRVRTVPSLVDSPVSWAPDGTTLVYADRPVDGPLAELRTVQPGMTQPQRLVDGTGADTSPVWSPAGDWIAFLRQDEAADGLWVVRPDGSEAHPIQLEAGWTYSAPVWAPDGSAVAFNRRPAHVGVDNAEPEIWIAPPNYKKPRQLAFAGRLAAWVP
jgi:Tol biopolymer transport system component